MKIGIIGAMKCEISSIQESITNSETEVIAKMVFMSGVVSDVFVVAVVCGIGKVNAAIGTSVLINHFEVDCIINVGIAGAADEKLNVKDIVISNEVTYHDFDTKQLVHNYPNMKEDVFISDKRLSELCVTSLKSVFNEKRIFSGNVVSGDRFIANPILRNKIRNSFNAACLDMEGAAIAHISYVYNVPFLLIKVISDKADEEASISFREFLQHVPQINKEVFKSVVEAVKQI